MILIDNRFLPVIDEIFNPDFDPVIDEIFNPDFEPMTKFLIFGSSFVSIFKLSSFPKRLPNLRAVLA